MLRKLIKHEYIATSRTMLPLLALFMLFSFAMRFVTTSLMDVSDLGAIGVLTTALVTLLYVIIFVAVVILGYFSSVMRFEKNIFTDEGYLMNTIPVASWMHIVTKLLAAVTWLILCGIACYASIMIVAYGRDSVKEVVEMIKVVFADIGLLFKASPLFVFQLALMIALNTIASYLTFYCAVAIGNSFSKAKKSLSVVTYIAIYIVYALITSVAADVMSDKMSSTLEISAMTDDEGIRMVNLMLLVLNVLVAIFGTGLFLLTNYFMKNKLNIE